MQMAIYRNCVCAQSLISSWVDSGVDERPANTLTWTLLVWHWAVKLLSLASLSSPAVTGESCSHGPKAPTLHVPLRHQSLCFNDAPSCVWDSVFSAVFTGLDVGGGVMFWVGILDNVLVGLLWVAGGAIQSSCWAIQSSWWGDSE